MALLIWKEEYGVGVKEIDDQHKKIFGLINRLYSAMVDLKEGEVINSIVEELVGYSHYHFGLEQEYFEKFNYPDKKSHEAEHEKFKNELIHFQKDINDKVEILPREVLTFLEDWWVKHINGTDKKYTEFFHEHGLY